MSREALDKVMECMWRKNTDLDQHIGKSCYVKRTPEDRRKDEYWIQYDEHLVLRKIDSCDFSEELDDFIVDFSDEPQVFMVTAVQIIYDGSLALRIKKSEKDFGYPARLEEVIFI